MVLRVGHSPKPHPSAKKAAVYVWTYTCAECGEEFDARKFTPCDADGTLYCGRHVPAGKHRWCSIGGHVFLGDRCEVSHDKSVKPSTPERFCAYCGESLNGYRSDAVYCSTRCRMAAHRQSA
ncbi:hypothetical protein [Microbacterium sp. NPDC058389]|uniref:hypothetical protein n=1 Tax=Microbacterium sp. NPDC058389 TaxID=3346475 RepID=UPI00365D55E3